MACYHKEEEAVVMVRVVAEMHMNGRWMAVAFGDAMKVDYDDDSVVLCHNHLEVAMHDDIQEGASKYCNLGQDPLQTPQVVVVVPYVVDKVVGSTQQAVVAEVIV